MASPAYVQHVFAAPHAAHGQLVHEGAVKNGWQLPAAQTSPPPQRVPQPPQFRGSVWKRAFEMHVLLQKLRPAVRQRVSTHAPATQRGLARPSPRQLFPHAPQF